MYNRAEHEVENGLSLVVMQMDVLVEIPYFAAFKSKMHEQWQRTTMFPQSHVHLWTERFQTYASHTQQEKQKSDRRNFNIFN